MSLNDVYAVIRRENGEVQDFVDAPPTTDDVLNNAYLFIDIRGKVPIPQIGWYYHESMEKFLPIPPDYMETDKQEENPFKVQLSPLQKEHLEPYVRDEQEAWTAFKAASRLLHEAHKGVMSQLQLMFDTTEFIPAKLDNKTGTWYVTFEFKEKKQQ